MQSVRSVLLLPKKILTWFRQHWKLALVILLAAAGLGYWQYQKTQAAKPVLTFEKPQKTNLIKTLEVSGLVDAKEKARLRFLAGGKLTYLGAKEGDTVKKGQTLATIDQAALRKQLDQSLNVYMKERWDWEQTLDSTKDRALPTTEQRTKDKEQWDLQNEVLDVEIADIAIQNTRLSSPLAGILTVSPAVTAGIQLAATDYFEVVNPATLVFRAAVDETDISQVQLGQQAEITLDAYAENDQDVISSSVSYMAFTSSQGANGTVFAVEFPLTADQGLGRYRLGMNGDVKITIDTRSDVLAIPLTATRERDDKTYVDVRTGENTYEEREIQVGLETEDQIEVLSGLTLNDEILIP